MRFCAQYRAEVEQICGITLNPLRQTVEEAIELTYVTELVEKIAPQPREVAVDPVRGEPEILTGTVVDAGAVVAEHLALALDPYPRTPGAVAETAPGAAEIPAPLRRSRR
ncbi:MAG TPA: YceD family protein [Alphaproteobacteria bacterium]|nr:YceD family protein [Alphaproteobacteria bacterium]